LGINCPIKVEGEITILTIAKLSSCLGGALIWFIILYWGITCLPDFQEKANKLIAKMNKLKVDEFEKNLIVISNDE